MKGIIYVELLGFLDQAGGPAFTEKVLAAAGLDGGGVFLRIGQYPWGEAVKIVTQAATITGQDADLLCEQFGAFLFERFTVLYPGMISAYASTDGLMAHIEDHIHEEVRILYPDAVTPKVHYRADGQDAFVVDYSSHRPFARIAYGLISGAMRHFGDDRTISWLSSEPRGNIARFRIA